MGTVIVPALNGTPTISGVALRATPVKLGRFVAIVDEKTIPEARVKVAVAVPEHALEVPEAPNPETVAVPVLEQVKVTVNAFVPVAAKATSVTVIVPLARVNEIAGES